MEEQEKSLFGALQAREAELAQVVADKAALGDRLAEAEAVELGKAQRKDAAEADAIRAAAAKNEADDNLAKAHAAKGSAKAAVQAKLDAMEKINRTWADNFEAVKTGTFAAKDWRSRNKCIDLVLGVLEAPDSLKLALEVALKERTEARGPFAANVVERGEAAFHEHIQHLSTQVEELKRVATAATEAITGATASASDAAAVLGAAQQASIDAQNDWLTATSAVAQLRARNFASQESNATSAIISAREALEEFRRHATECRALDNKPPPSAAEVAPAAVEAPIGDATAEVVMDPGYDKSPVEAC